MKVFLAGTQSRQWIVKYHEAVFSGGGTTRYQIQRALANENDMKIFLAGVAPWKEEGLYDESIKQHRPYILESYYYANEDTERLLPFYGDFLLDSGAFTFIQNKSATDKNFDAYLEEYADFINRNHVTQFFELDVDSITGYEKVKEYRRRLEKLTGKQCIPVWHRQRGLDEYVRHCDEYPYVAIGGIAIKEIKKPEYPVFTKLLNIAHERDTRVHGLGFTQLNEIWKYKFDTVDSTAWVAGNRFGYVYWFDGKTMRKYAKPNSRMIRSKEVALHNYCEWIKFQQYADKYL